MLVRGLRYQLEVHGEGPPLLLLHGFTGSAASWRDLAERLDQQYRLILVDLPGHGATETPTSDMRGTMPELAADLATILTALGAAPAHVLGYSMGGRLALYLALSAPGLLRSLIVESGSPGLRSGAEREARRASDEALATRIEHEGIAAFVDEWERLPLWQSQEQLSPDVRGRLRTQRLQNSPHGLASSLRALGTGAQPALWDELARLAVPTLLVAGRLDQKFTAIAQRMHTHIPDSTLVLIDAAGHTPHLEQPERFAAALRAFLISRQFGNISY